MGHRISKLKFHKRRNALSKAIPQGYRVAKENGKITLAVLGTKVDAQTEAIKALLRSFEEHVAQDRAVEIKVDRLDQIEISRRWHFRAIWGSIIAGMIAFVSNLFRTQ